MITARTMRRSWLGPQQLLVAGSAAFLAAGAAVVVGPAALAIALVLPLTLVAAVRAPGVILAAYLLVPFYKAALQPYSPVDITLALAAANALQAVMLVLDRRGGRAPLTAVGLWLATGAMVLGGVLYAPDQGLAVDRMASYWLLVVLPILPAAVRVGRDHRYMRQLLWAFLAIGLLVTALGVTQVSAGSRLVVLDMNTIQVARAAMFVPILGITFLWPMRSTGWRAVVLVGIPAATLVAVASGSRGPLLAMILVVLAVVLTPVVTSRRPSGRALPVAAVLGSATLVVLAVALPSLPEYSVARFTDLAEFLQGGASDETSAAARVELFRVAIDFWAAAPLVGLGTAGFETMAPRVLGLDAGAYPHNFVLQVGADHGLVGVAVVGALVVAAFRHRGRAGTGADPARALAAFLLLNAMVSGDFLADRATLGILLVVLIYETAPTSSRWDAAAGPPRPQSAGTPVRSTGAPLGDGGPR